MEQEGNLVPCPRIVGRLDRLLTLSLIGSLVCWLWGLGFAWWAWFGGAAEGPEVVFRRHWFWAAIPLAIAWRLWRKRSTHAPAWALIGFAMFLATWVESVTSTAPDPFYALTSAAPLTIWDQLLLKAGVDFPRLGAFLISLWLFLAAFRALALSLEVRSWFGSTPASDLGFAGRAAGGPGARRRIVGSLAIAYLVFAAFACIVVVVSPFLPFSLNGSPPFGPAGVGEIEGFFSTGLPAVAAFGVLVWNLTERLLIDDEGVRLFLFDPRFTVFFAPWARIKRIDLIRHSGNLASAIVHYRSRLRIPGSFGIHFKRYSDPQAVSQRLIGAAMELGVQTRGIRSASWMALAGWLTILAGLGLAAAHQIVSSRLMDLCNSETFPSSRYPEIAGIFPLTALCLSSTFVVGVGLGILSGYHRGAPRFLLLLLWVSASRMLPDPILHWLVYIAIFSILSARMGYAARHDFIPFPPVWQWDLAFTLVLLAPAFATLGYFLGVPIARRKLPAGMEFDPEPEPASLVAAALGSSRTGPSDSGQAPQATS